MRKARRILSLWAEAMTVAGVFTLLAGLGVLRVPDLAVSDVLYQRRMASDGEIVLVGIDQKALEERRGGFPTGCHRLGRAVRGRD